MYEALTLFKLSVANARRSLTLREEAHDVRIFRTAVAITSAGLSRGSSGWILWRRVVLAWLNQASEHGLLADEA